MKNKHLTDKTHKMMSVECACPICGVLHYKTMETEYIMSEFAWRSISGVLIRFCDQCSRH